MHIEITSIKQNGQSLVAHVKGFPGIDPNEDHPVYFHVDAIGSRMAMYELSDPSEGLGAILKEHCARMSDDFKTPQTSREAVKQLPELASIQVDGIEKASQVISKHSKRIQQAYMARK